MKKLGVIFIFGILISLSFISSQEGTIGVSYCAERTVSGAWCQNVPLDKVDKSLRYVPTSCEATSYCKLGTCIDSKEGICMENTPQKVCQDAGGLWDEKESDEIAQCNLGCCSLGDQAAYVTQTRCRQLSSIYGLESDFNPSVSSESACILSASSSVKGACVYERDLQKTCTFTTQENCLSGDYGDSVDFHEEYLCSAEVLGTDCSRTKNTKCVEDKDEVYFLDSCGNLANIYDSSKIDDTLYWTKVVDKEESCNPNSNNAGSSSCGNCDYYLGSTCKEYERSKDRVNPSYGDNVCRDLSCNYDGEKYQHGETWCADVESVSSISPDFENGNPESENLPGSRYFRLVCYNGEVSVESCGDYRQKICIESDIEGFSTAACRVNKWQDCIGQDNQLDCENSDRRDCMWIEGVELVGISGGSKTGVEEREKAFAGSSDESTRGQPFSGTGNAIFDMDGEEVEEREEGVGSCVPKYAPGFNFWSSSEAESICAQASIECVVTYETGLGGGKECVDGCECLQSSWIGERNNLCVSLGDCGASLNYVGVEGYYDEEALYSRSGEEDKTDEE